MFIDTCNASSDSRTFEVKLFSDNPVILFDSDKPPSIRRSDTRVRTIGRLAAKEDMHGSMDTCMNVCNIGQKRWNPQNCVRAHAARHAIFHNSCQRFSISCWVQSHGNCGREDFVAGHIATRSCFVSSDFSRSSAFGCFCSPEAHELHHLAWDVEVFPYDLSIGNHCTLGTLRVQTQLVYDLQVCSLPQQILGLKSGGASAPWKG